MLIIPQDYPPGRYHLSGDGRTMTYVHENKSRIQLTAGESTVECYWTPNQYFGDCLLNLYRSNFLEFKESAFNAEFSDGRKIATSDWRPALDQVSECSDDQLRYVEFAGSNGRSILVTSISADQQLDIGLKAESKLIGAFRGALFLTAAPKPVKLAWNKMIERLFPRQFRDLYIRV